MTRSPVSAVNLIAYLGDAHTMSELLNQGFEVNALDAHHKGPLWWAALQGHEAVVDLLLSQKNVNVNGRGLVHHRAGSNRRYIKTPPGVATYMGKPKMVEFLIEPEDVDVNPWFYRSPLVTAAQQGHSAIVRLLLTRKDIEVNSRDLFGRTPLRYAAGCGRVDIVRQLLNIEDTQVNCVDKQRCSPLMAAAFQGHEGVAKLLLGRADIAVNTKDSLGQTALHKAAERGKASVVKLLSDHPDVAMTPTDNRGRNIFALVSDKQNYYSKYGEKYVHRIEDLEECGKILRAAVKKRSQDRSRVIGGENP